MKHYRRRRETVSMGNWQAGRNRAKPGEGRCIIGPYSSLKKRMRALKRYGTLSHER